MRVHRRRAGRRRGGPSWYFGAFAPYRRADVAATIEAVLAAHPGYVAATLGRLARHGRLDALLAALGARRILAALDASAAASSATGVGVLVDAALQLAALGGWTIDGGHRQTIRQALLARHRDAAPAWQDRHLMSAFVWACVEDVAEMLRARGVTRADGDRGALVRALHDDLDWLDAPWLLARLDAAGAGTDDGRRYVSAAQPPGDRAHAHCDGGGRRPRVVCRVRRR